MSCIGAAIFDEQGLPCAGVSVSGPSARFGPEAVEAFGQTVVAAAQEITSLSGGIAPKASVEGEEIEDWKELIKPTATRVRHCIYGRLQSIIFGLF